MAELLANSSVPGKREAIGELNGSLTAGATGAGALKLLATIAKNTGLRAAGEARVIIDSEIIRFRTEEGTPTEYEILERGAEESTAAAHAANTKVYCEPTVGSLMAALVSTALAQTVTGQKTFQGGPLLEGTAETPARVKGPTTEPTLSAELLENTFITGPNWTLNPGWTHPAPASTGSFTAELTNLSTTIKITAEEGAVVVGQEISGEGIAAGTFVIEKKAVKEFVISKAATATKTSVLTTFADFMADLTAGSTTIKNPTPEPNIKIGQEISGAGIPAKTTVVSKKAAKEWVISKAVEAGKTATKVPIKAVGPGAVLEAGAEGALEETKFKAVIGALYRVEVKTEGAPGVPNRLIPSLGITEGEPIYGTITDIQMIEATAEEGFKLTPNIGGKWNGTIATVSVKRIEGAVPVTMALEGSGSFPIRQYSVNSLWAGTNAGRLAKALDSSFLVFGYRAGESVLESNELTFYGDEAGRHITTGKLDMAFGAKALGAATVSSNCTASGTNALSTLRNGNEDAGFGVGAGAGLKIGSGNVFGGYNAWAALEEGNENVVLGVKTGEGAITATRVSLLGAGTTATTGLSEATAIGYGAKVGQSKSVTIGRSTDVVGIGLSEPAFALDVSEAARIKKGVGVWNHTPPATQPKVAAPGAFKKGTQGFETEGEAEAIRKKLTEVIEALKGCGIVE